MHKQQKLNAQFNLVLTINFLGIRVFGELEFWFSSIKVVTLIGLILMGIIIDLGGNPKHDRIGFRYWKHPNGPFGHFLQDKVHDDSASVFLGFWSTLTNALFAYIGTELIGVTVGEAENPRRNIPKAIRRTFYRILVFYVGGVFVIGLVVPSTDKVGRNVRCSRAPSVDLLKDTVCRYQCKNRSRSQSFRRRSVETNQRKIQH